MSNVFRDAWRVVLLTGAMAGVTGHAHAADYTLTVEPTYPADQIRPVYGPLLSYLNRTTGHRFTLRSAPNFNQHWRDLRAGVKTDFVFEEGHFHDYRRKRSGAMGLVRTQENSAFAITVENPEIINEGQAGIIGRSVASLGAPNLGYVLVFDAFKNPLAQPEVRAISTKWSDGPDLIFSGDVEGALVPTYMSSENPALTEVWRSPEVPGRVFSASPELPQDVRQKVLDALLKLHEDPEAYNVMTELRTERFVAVDGVAYDGLERLLSNTFGYTSPVQANPTTTPPAPAPAAPATEEAPSGVTVGATPKP